MKQTGKSFKRALKPVCLSFLLYNLVATADEDDRMISSEPRQCPFVEQSYTNPLTNKFKLGDKCETHTIKTRNYGPAGQLVQWTLVKEDKGRYIWAADIDPNIGGVLYVGYIKDGYYTFNGAIRACKKRERVVFDGKSYSIKMALPKMGFGYGGASVNDPLNFELLIFLNYNYVVGGGGQRFWSSTKIGSGWFVDGLSIEPGSGLRRPISADFLAERHLVLCVGVGGARSSTPIPADDGRGR